MLAMTFTLMLEVGVMLTIICVIDGDEIPHVKLDAAGASFPASVYHRWMQHFEDIRSPYVSLRMSYTATGSGEGQKRILGEKSPPVDYAGSDYRLLVNESVPYDSTPIAAHHLQLFPTMAGGVAICFHLPGIRNLSLTRDHLTGIYNGTYTWWNDTALKDSNPDVDLPTHPIIVIARADEAGTTEMFTAALSHFSPEWNETYGTFIHGLHPTSWRPYHWDGSVVSYYGYTGTGVAGLLLSIPFSVGYIPSADAKRYQLSTAAVQNRHGAFVHVTEKTIRSAMAYYANATFDSAYDRCIVDGGYRDSYPIAGYTYIIASTTDMPCDKAAEFYRYTEWFLSNDIARSECGEYNMVALEDGVVSSVMRVLETQMMCENRMVASVVREMRDAEELVDADDWMLTLIIIVSALAFLLTVLSIYICIHLCNLRRSLSRDTWIIPIQEIQIVRDRRLSCQQKASSPPSSAPQAGLSSSARPLKCSISASLASDRIHGKWAGKKVTLQKTYLGEARAMPPETGEKLVWMKQNISHQNITRFYGVTTRNGYMYLVSEYCFRGNLASILHLEKLQLDYMMLFSMAMDIVLGMEYLHKVDIIHGALTSASCWLDTKWTVKVADWELYFLANSQKTLHNQQTTMKQSCVSLKETSSENHEVGMTPADHGCPIDIRHWTAPELLQGADGETGGAEELRRQPDRASDVYNFGVLLWELMEPDGHGGAQQKQGLDPDRILLGIHSNLAPKARCACPSEVQALTRQCLQENPKLRPSFTSLKKTMRRLFPGKHDVVDYMMEKLEQRTEKLKETMQRHENLLHQMLPPCIAESLSRGEPVTPELFESVTIYFSDIVGFTCLSAHSTPMEIVTLLNALYTTFDTALDRHDVHKMEIIGDAYMVTSGLPVRNGVKHAGHIASTAIDLACAISAFQIPHRPGQKLRLRIGIHSGAVVAGVVGLKVPRYTIFGDTVNTASRMESTSVALKIQISEATRELLRELGGYVIQPRGLISVKGKGQMQTYWLHGHEGQLDKMPEEFLRDVPLDVP